jgi:hypothetical protein
MNDDASAIQELFESDQSAFPYDGCRAVLALSAGEYGGLIPDLDLYFFRIAGYAGSVKTMRTWPMDRLRKAREDLANSFFEENPEYELLQRDITDEIAPDLASRLRLFEELRTRLLRFAKELERV